MQKKISKIIHQVSLITNTPYEVVEAIFESQFECAKNKIKEATPGNTDTFVNVRFINLGMLIANKPKVLKLHEDDKNSTENSNI